MSCCFCIFLLIFSMDEAILLSNYSISPSRCSKDSAVGFWRE